MRNFFIRFLPFLVSFHLIGIPSCFALDSRGPYLVDLRPDRADVVYHTDEETEAILECHAQNRQDRLIWHESGKGRRHVFRLQNLEPGSRYSYRVIQRRDDEGRHGVPTEWFVFRTPEDTSEEISFIVYGDSRDSSPSPKRHKKVAGHFLKHHPDFVISTGDFLVGGPTGSSSMFGTDWTENFFNPLQGVLETCPYYPVVGNHDQDSEEAAKALQIAFPDLEQSFHYAFRRGNIHFIILHVADQMKEFQNQKGWFVKELTRARDADWRVVFLHVSPFTQGKYKNSKWTLDGREDFLKTCVRNKVDLVLSGHDHSYQRFLPLRKTESDTHSVLFVVTALAGTNPYKAREDTYTAKVVNDTDHFCVVQASRDRLELTAYDNQNEAFDHVVLSKHKKDLGKVWKNMQQY
jgi:acid phosphatase type 7